MPKSIDIFKGNPVIIVDQERAYGPFDSVTDAQDWIEAPHRVVRPYCFVRLYAPAAPATAETAHHCGDVLR